MLESTQRLALDRFLASVEKRACRMAQIQTRDHDTALDIVQDAMVKLVQNYSDHSEDELSPLFYRILFNRLNDWHRSQKRWWRRFQSLFDEEDTLAQSESLDEENPLTRIQHASALAQLEQAIQQLPRGQQQTFMLRCWDGLSTRETAQAMDCSEGTVKTQYSRAVNALKQKIDRDWP